MGDFIPQTPDRQRGGADFWFMPQLTAPPLFTQRRYFQAEPF